jgi:hypothetical protein
VEVPRHDNQRRYAHQNKKENILIFPEEASLQ